MCKRNVLQQTRCGAYHVSSAYLVGVCLIPMFNSHPVVSTKINIFTPNGLQGDEINDGKVSCIKQMNWAMSRWPWSWALAKNLCKKAVWARKPVCCLSRPGLALESWKLQRSNAFLPLTVSKLNLHFLALTPTWAYSQRATSLFKAGDFSPVEAAREETASEVSSHMQINPLLWKGYT